jgi:hypothetical protein
MPVLSLPSWRTVKALAHVAQSVEHFLGKEEVTGSIPVMSTTHSTVMVSPETGSFLQFIDSIGV